MTVLEDHPWCGITWERGNVLRWDVLHGAFARHIIIVIIIIVYNLCVFVTSGTYHFEVTYSTSCSFYEISSLQGRM